MVAAYANLLAVKLSAERCEGIGGSEAKIPEEKDDVVGIDESIPIGNEGFVHLLDRLIWSSGVADDVMVGEVSIGYEPLIHFRLSLRSCVSQPKSSIS